jgi:membrane-bound metal-dependent hydrolase YbcI (DUF457 family)
MLGRDHALSGALAFAAAAPLLHVTGAHLAAGIALTAGAGVLPDIDEPGSTIARTFGFLTGAFAWIVHKISGGHRKGTHSLFGVALLTAGSLAAGSWQAGAQAAGGHPQPWWHLVPAALILALLFSAGFRALHIGGHHGDAAGVALAALAIWKGWDLVLVPPRHVPVLAVCLALGMLAHIAGDMCTHDGCPLLYPVVRHEFGLLPAPIRFTTNKLAEHWIVTPLLIAGIAYFLWRDVGSPASIHVHLAGGLARRHRGASIEPMRRNASTVVVLAGQVPAEVLTAVIRSMNVTLIRPVRPEDAAQNGAADGAGDLEAAAAALGQAARTTSPYALVTADPLASVAASWQAMWDVSRQQDPAAFEQEAARAVAAWRAGRFELPDYYLVLATDPAEHGPDFHLGPVHASRPHRVAVVAATEPAQQAAGVLHALGSLRHGPWWPPLDQMIETARTFYPDSLAPAPLNAGTGSDD